MNLMTKLIYIDSPGCYPYYNLSLYTFISSAKSLQKHPICYGKKNISESPISSSVPLSPVPFLSLSLQSDKFCTFPQDPLSRRISWFHTLPSKNNFPFLSFNTAFLVPHILKLLHHALLTVLICLALPVKAYGVQRLGCFFFYLFVHSV